MSTSLFHSWEPSSVDSPSMAPNTLNLCKLSALPLNWPWWPALNPLSILKTCSGFFSFLQASFFTNFFLPSHSCKYSIWLQKLSFRFCLFRGVWPFAHKKPLVNVCFRTASGSCYVPVMRLCLWFHPWLVQFWTMGPVMCCLNHVIFLKRKEVSKLL